MSMNEAWPMLLVGLAGFALGLIFFGGLWWTVRCMLHSARPALWMLGSLLLRTAFALSGFWLLGGHDWKRMLACLAGFFIARVVLTWLPRLWQKRSLDAATEDRHASQP
jgi:F1F0 ATPase subunit 2